MTSPIVNVQKQIGSLIDKAIHKAQTTADCEAYCFWDGVSVFVRTLNEADTVRCAVTSELTCQAVVENHRPHRIYISLTSTPNDHQLEFGHMREMQWAVAEEIEPHIETTRYTSEFTAIYDEQLHRNGDASIETITTDIERKVVDPENLQLEENDRKQETIQLTLL
ncbi:hypothetical protein V5735_19085 [Haladaptatus sp. SPP-AMP-3]|uniref:hypothetical protein n=1 Tax=Haladaptatus sp. SPP-AMP-3 TaxID=3121295 RepID=UPI003C2FB13B